MQYYKYYVGILSRVSPNGQYSYSAYVPDWGVEIPIHSGVDELTIQEELTRRMHILEKQHAEHLRNTSKGNTLYTAFNPAPVASGRYPTILKVKHYLALQRRSVDECIKVIPIQFSV